MKRRRAGAGDELVDLARRTRLRRASRRRGRGRGGTALIVAAVGIPAALVGAGFTATAVLSLTAEPPQIGVAINKTVSAYEKLLKSRCFCRYDPSF